jgi:pimeloyl-ACP methyl ester carboxylesterase
MAQGGALTAVALSYDDEGSGHPLLFLHGGACDRSFWRPQVLHFRNRYRVVLPDLRGHGRSPVPGGDYSVENFANDVAALAGSLAIEGATVIGHSLGGLVAFALPALHPGVAGRVVALDSPLSLPPHVAAAFAEMGAHSRDEFRSALRRASKGAVSVDADPDLQAHIAAAQDATDLDCFISLSGHAFANSYDDLLAECDVPALLVTATIPNDMDRLGHLCPQLHVGKVVGSGHFLELEVPDQVNAMLDRFLQLTSEAEV